MENFTSLLAVGALYHPQTSLIAFIDFMQSVPLFHFYKNGTLLEAFATRDKERILAAILKYTSAPSEDALANLGRL